MIQTNYFPPSFMNDYSGTAARNFAKVFVINQEIKLRFIYESHFKTKLNNGLCYAWCLQAESAIIRGKIP